MFFKKINNIKIKDIKCVNGKQLLFCITPRAARFNCNFCYFLLFTFYFIPYPPNHQSQSQSQLALRESKTK